MTTPIPSQSVKPSNPLRKLSLAVAAVLVLILVSASVYTVDAAEQAIVLQFGRVIGEPITEPGIHFKTPFVQEVRRFEKRRLSWDGEPEQIPTKGREFIEVDTTARWRIVDALQFLKSVRDIPGARSRLDDVIDSVVRDRVSSTELVEIVRSSTWDVSERDIERVVIPGGEDTGQLDRKVEVGREQLELSILADASKAVAEYGIELVDVRIKRLNYIDSVREQVFNRMISERQRIAEQFRSEGEGEASRIRGDTSLELARISSEAQRQAEVLRGEADAEAARIYNEAFGQDPEFYSFQRSLNSYQETLGAGTTMFLGTDSPYLRHLQRGPAKD